jgi:predicted transcriptional regulator of viral defense system
MNRTLSKNEAKVILDLEWRNQRLVTLAQLRNTLGASESYARYLAHSLVRKGWLERLRPGLYQLVPAERGPDGVGDTNPLAAGAALVSPYFFSFGTACTHHGLTEQLFSEVHLACQQRRPPKILRGTRYLFIYVREIRFYGFKEVAVLGIPVQMATAERALLDAIDRPRYAGGVGEVSHIASRAIGRISWDVLLEDVERWRSSALVQRLGYLLDLHQADMPTEARRALLRLVRPRSKIHLGSRRRWGTSGRLVQPWNVIENVPLEVLVAIGESPRRRIEFPRRNIEG